MRIESRNKAEGTGGEYGQAPRATAEPGSAKRFLRLHWFNMVEVALAMGVLSWGAVVVTELFPVSLTASRDSISESYAAHSAELFLAVFRSRLRMRQNGEYVFWNQLCQDLPTAKPDSDEPDSDEWSEWFADDTMTIQRHSTPRFFRVAQQAQGMPVPDFCAVYRMWRGPVAYSYYSDGQWCEAEANPDIAIAVNVEVSWPANIPYQRRRKALYSMDFCKVSL